MKSSSRYGERDYAFGQMMLTLRTSIGLTQAGLAEQPGCLPARSERSGRRAAVIPKPSISNSSSRWGCSLRPLPLGREAEEIRALWQAAHQKLLLDEHWLAALLGNQRPALTLLPPQPVEEIPTPVSRPRPSLRWGRGWIGARRWRCQASMAASERWPP